MLEVLEYLIVVVVTSSLIWRLQYNFDHVGKDHL